MDDIKEKLHEVFSLQNGYAKTSDLRNAGITNYYIKRFEENGVITRIKRGMYCLNEGEIIFNDGLIEVFKLVPRGVLCLLSAVAYYELSTINPWIYHVAIERNQKKPVLPDYPPIQLYYFNMNAYEKEIEEVEVDGGKVKIYSIEKTICDIARYRNTIGKDIMIECLKNYMGLPTRNITKLMNCAKMQKADKVLMKYIEVLM